METLSKAKVKLIVSLQKKKFRIQHSQFIIEGTKLIQEALDHNPSLIAFVVKTPQHKFHCAQVQMYSCPDGEFNKLSSLSTPDGVLAVCNLPKCTLNLPKASKLVIIDQISDPGNLGTIIRTADWFQADHLILTKNSVDCFNSKVVQASMGSIFRLPIVYAPDIEEILDSIKQHNFHTIGLSLNGSEYAPDLQPPKIALIFGSESHGIPASAEAQVDFLYKIPGNPQTESLNLSIAAGIAMHQFFK